MPIAEVGIEWVKYTTIFPNYSHFSKPYIGYIGHAHNIDQSAAPPPNPKNRCIGYLNRLGPIRGPTSPQARSRKLCVNYNDGTSHTSCRLVTSKQRKHSEIDKDMYIEYILSVFSDKTRWRNLTMNVPRRRNADSTMKNVVPLSIGMVYRVYRTTDCTMLCANQKWK